MAALNITLYKIHKISVKFQALVFFRTVHEMFKENLSKTHLKIKAARSRTHK